MNIHCKLKLLYIIQKIISDIKSKVEFSVPNAKDCDILTGTT